MLAYHIMSYKFISFNQCYRCISHLVSSYIYINTNVLQAYSSFGMWDIPSISLLISRYIPCKYGMSFVRTTKCSYIYGGQKCSPSFECVQTRGSLDS